MWEKSVKWLKYWPWSMSMQGLGEVFKDLSCLNNETCPKSFKISEWWHLVLENIPQSLRLKRQLIIHTCDKHTWPYSGLIEIEILAWDRHISINLSLSLVEIYISVLIPMLCWRDIFVFWPLPLFNAWMKHVCSQFRKKYMIQDYCFGHSLD